MNYVRVSVIIPCYNENGNAKVSHGSGVIISLRAT
jgi:hypothetical protein